MFIKSSEQSYFLIIFSHPKLRCSVVEGNLKSCGKPVDWGQLRVHPHALSIPCPKIERAISNSKSLRLKISLISQPTIGSEVTYKSILLSFFSIPLVKKRENFLRGLVLVSDHFWKVIGYWGPHLESTIITKIRNASTVLDWNKCARRSRAEQDRFWRARPKQM